MSFRGKTPVYVRIGGLTSERGQHMNGKCGWAVKATAKVADLSPDSRREAASAEGTAFARKRARRS